MNEFDFLRLLSDMKRLAARHDTDIKRLWRSFPQNADEDANLIGGFELEESSESNSSSSSTSAAACNYCGLDPGPDPENASWNITTSGFAGSIGACPDCTVANGSFNLIWIHSENVGLCERHNYYSNFGGNGWVLQIRTSSNGNQVSDLRYSCNAQGLVTWQWLLANSCVVSREAYGCSSGDASLDSIARIDP